MAVVVAAHTTDRPAPDHNYRPDLPVDAIESGCYPLPGDAHLDGLAYQVRSDRDVTTEAGERRELLGQYDVVDLADAQELLTASFVAVGFQPDAGSAPGQVTLRRAGERIGITLRELPDTSAATLVRGEFELDLPVAPLARPDDPECGRLSTTKRWAQPLVAP